MNCRECHCGLCRVCLGKKVNTPHGFCTVNNPCIRKSKNSYLISSGSISTSYDSNIKIGKLSDNIYIVMCRACKSTIAVKISSKPKKNCVALLSDSWKNVQQVVEQKQCNHNTINKVEDLIDIDGIANSPVMIHSINFSVENSNTSMDSKDDLFDDTYDIVQDCTFGSLYNSAVSTLYSP